MKNTSRLFLLLVLILMPMAFSHAYDGPGQLVTLMTVQKDNGSFYGASYAVDEVLSCTGGNNAYVNGGEAGEVWFNLGADYYVEGMEILVRTEDETQDRETGIYAECYTTMESARTSDWFNNNQKAIRDTAGSWHRFYMRSGTTNVKTHFIKIRIDNIGYPKPCAVGEIRVYARPTPGVELPSSSYKLLSQTNTNIVSPALMVDGTTDYHAFVDPYRNGGIWIELDKEYPIAGFQVELHSETPGGASLSFYAYGTPAGGTHEGYYEKTAPPGAVVGFEKNSGVQQIDYVPYSAQYPQDNACGHHRTHWYTMQHTYGHLGQKAKYIYIYLDNSNNDKPMCIDDIRVFRSYDLTEDGVSLSQTTFPNNGENHRPTVSVKGQKKTMNGGVISYTPYVDLTDIPYAQYYSPAEYADYVVHYPEASKEGGTYTLTVEGLGIYTGTITKEYYIKLPSQIVLDRDFLHFQNVKTEHYKTQYVNILSQVGDGELTISVRDQAVATAVLDGNRVQVKEVYSDDTLAEMVNTTLVLTKAETDKYMGCTVSVPIQTRTEYIPVGRYFDISNVELKHSARMSSPYDGLTEAQLLHLTVDRDLGNYAYTVHNDPYNQYAFYSIYFNEPKDLCDAIARHATSYPGDLTVHFEFHNENGTKLCTGSTNARCDARHRQVRVWPQNTEIIENVKRVTVNINYSGLSGDKRAHIYEVAFYEPVEVNHTLPSDGSERMVNTVPKSVPNQSIYDYVVANGKVLSGGTVNSCEVGAFYAPKTKIYDITYSDGTFGENANGDYVRKTAYRDVLGVIEDQTSYKAVSEGIRFMRGTAIVTTGQDKVFGDNATVYQEAVVEENTNIISYTGDWQTGDGSKRFAHAKVIHVAEGQEGKASFKVYLKETERVQITTDIGPYQGRANVTLSLGNKVYATDYIDGFFPASLTNTDTYKISNLTGSAGDTLNSHRKDYWDPAQVNTFTAPEEGVYTVEISVPWASYLVSGLGGRYTFDEPACLPCTVINSVEILPANEEWNFSFSENQLFNFSAFGNCTLSLDRGDLVVTVSEIDHNFISDTGLNIDANVYKGIEVIEQYDIKNLYYMLNGGQHEDVAQVFYTRTDAQGFDVARHSSITLTTASTGNQYIVHYFDMSSDPEWTGTIDTLRFDLNNGPEGMHRIRAIRLVRK